MWECETFYLKGIYETWLNPKYVFLKKEGKHIGLCYKKEI